MKVTIAIPSYNLANFIGQAIESVLRQSFTDWELLIEDDGSQDGSLAVIGQYDDPRITVVSRGNNIGANGTTNNLVQRAKGEYIALLAADDVWEPTKLEKQVAYLDANPECGIVFSHPRFMLERGEPHKYQQEGIEDIKNMPRESWQERFKVGNCLFISTSLYRRSLHDELGYFSEDLSILADLEWYVRIVKNHDLHIIQEPLATVRFRDNMANLSAPKKETMIKHCDELEIVRDRHYQVKRDKPKYMFATPFYEVKGYSNYILSMFQTVYALAKKTNVDFDFIELSGDSYVWRARNLLVERFLLSDCTHLIFIDSDQGWSLESIMRLLKADKEVVGGVYPTKNNWEHYACTVFTDEKGIPEVEKESGLIRAQKVPTGFMKIKREVFDKLRKAYPQNWYWENAGMPNVRRVYNYFGHLTVDHVALGEDISFCNRWLTIGGELWVEPRCTISHVGTKTWIGNYHQYLLRQPGGSEAEAA